MTKEPLMGIGLFAGAALILYWLCMRYDPKKPHARLLRHGVVGLMMLLGWNLLPLPHIGVTPLAAVATGVLGLPGMGLMAFINLLP